MLGCEQGAVSAFFVATIEVPVSGGAIALGFGWGVSALAFSQPQRCQWARWPHSPRRVRDSTGPPHPRDGQATASSATRQRVDPGSCPHLPPDELCWPRSQRLLLPRPESPTSKHRRPCFDRRNGYGRPHQLGARWVNWSLQARAQRSFSRTSIISSHLHDGKCHHHHTRPYRHTCAT